MDNENGREFTPLVCPRCGTSYVDLDPVSGRAKIYVPHNKNEYFLDGRRFVEKIESCVCKAIDGEKNALDCQIAERACKSGWFFLEGSDHIVRNSDGLKLFLSESAKKTVFCAIGTYRDRVSEIKENAETVSFDREDGKRSTVFFRHASRFAYDAVWEEEREEKKSVRVLSEVPFSSIVQEVFSFFGILSPEKQKAVFDLFIDRAKASNDGALLLQLRHLSNLTTPEETRRLEKELGERILPVLPEEYDVFYSIDADEEYLPLLLRSNYKLHRREKNVSFFAGWFTYAKWRLNPHTRSGERQARMDLPSIPFSEYLNLLDEYEKQKGEKRRDG